MKYKEVNCIRYSHEQISVSDTKYIVASYTETF